LNYFGQKHAHVKQQQPVLSTTMYINLHDIQKKERNHPQSNTIPTLAEGVTLHERYHVNDTRLTKHTHTHTHLVCFDKQLHSDRM
jgi:hypothetical protein